MLLLCRLKMPYNGCALRRFLAIAKTVGKALVSDSYSNSIKSFG